MAQCITCGTELHPERAEKYNYCMARECQEKNATGLTMMAIGMNKAAEELMILDERTQADLASGRYHDQRRGSFGTSASAPAPGTVARDSAAPAGRARRRPSRRTAAPAPVSRPYEIAAKLGVSTYLATQIVLAARDRRRPEVPAVLRSDPSPRTRKPA